MTERGRINWTAIGIVAGLLIQLMVSVWWTSKLDSRVYSLECWVNESKPKVAAIESMKQTDETMLKLMTEMKASVDRMSDRMWQLHGMGKEGNGR